MIDPDELPDSLVSMMDSTPCRRTDDPPLRTFPKLPPLDQPKKELIGHALLSKDTSPAFRVKHLLDCYRMAVQLVYGMQSWAYHHNDITRSKAFAPLRESAALLIEHDIAPGSWAEWALGVALKKRFPKKPPPINLVFAPSFVSKRRGWFRKTNDESRSRSSVTPRYHEQLLRRREKLSRWRGWLKDPMLGMPQWYRDLRDREIAMGLEDPLDAYPMPKENRRGGR